ncbi:hypothetical protein G7K_2667-t1 [Saitoella complicata NRRL Y-17804]|uniref:EF-hand domain-containing protein n=1 Tax=Saitoella complicata (strain BCRC 22490 / CBS 7301 / JCM 7358 / NBRC 10748 / NRRL Y-17804) TaxID=698492 RepID=A0A0E9NF78_SAICN|nr:hypothetical protein G7K_2667-t1 [Saitoella complicata NRRL Y-17804]
MVPSDHDNSPRRSSSTARDADEANEPGVAFNKADETFDRYANNPAHVPHPNAYQPPRRPLTRLGRWYAWVLHFSIVTRYAIYILPLAILLLVPTLAGGVAQTGATIGGVRLLWWGVWWEIIWLSLWGSKIVAKCLPTVLGEVVGLWTNSAARYIEAVRAIELALTMFCWSLSCYVSFLPIMTQNPRARREGRGTQHYQSIINNILLAIFIGMILNLIEKIFIQLLAISFHQRTYQDRIVLNKFEVNILTKLWVRSRTVLPSFEEDEDYFPTGAMTPNRQFFYNVGRQARRGLREVTDVALNPLSEITGGKIARLTSPQAMVQQALITTAGSQGLARRFFNSFKQPENDALHFEDFADVFEDAEEAERAFAMFDKDMNGDLTREEMEQVCVEIGRERKSITSSLKDVDSAVSKLDNVLTFVVAIITLLVFLGLLNAQFRSTISSASTTLLALSWLFSVTAQEVLGSIVFLFVKHPFDVGDRVDIDGDQFIVKEMQLMATVFKRLDGRTIQAPNNLLNTKYIHNIKRSGEMSETVKLQVKFGTTLEEIEALRLRMLDFVRAEKRDYAPTIVIEVQDMPALGNLTLTININHKSNWQNDALRAQRRNKFMCALRNNILDLGIAGGDPGAGDKLNPFYIVNMHGPQMLEEKKEDKGKEVELPPTPKDSSSLPPPVPDIRISPGTPTGSPTRHPSSPVQSPTSERALAPIGSVERELQDLHNSEFTEAFPTSPRGAPLPARASDIESIHSHESNRGKRMDYTFGASDAVAANELADVYEDNASLVFDSQPIDRAQERLGLRSHDSASVSSLSLRPTDSHGSSTHSRLGRRWSRARGRKGSETSQTPSMRGRPESDAAATAGMHELAEIRVHSPGEEGSRGRSRSIGNEHGPHGLGRLRAGTGLTLDPLDEDPNEKDDDGDGDIGKAAVELRRM